MEGEDLILRITCCFVLSPTDFHEKPREELFTDRSILRGGVCPPLNIRNVIIVNDTTTKTPSLPASGYRRGLIACFTSGQRGEKYEEGRTRTRLQTFIGTVLLSPERRLDWKTCVYHVALFNPLRWNATHVENFLSRNCNIFSVLNIFKYN